MCVAAILAVACGASAMLTPVTLDAAKAAGELRLWRSARLQSRPVELWELRLFFKRSDRDLQAQLGLVQTKSRDATVRALAVSVALSFVGSAAVSNADFISSDARTTLALGVGLLPYAVLSAGLAIPATLRAGLNSVLRVYPPTRRRQAYHEAGHFLVGYMAGLPIEGYSVSAAETAVRFGELDGDADLIDSVSCISMAGIAAEVISFGNAAGGLDDLAQLRVLLARAAVTKRSVQDARIRWATLMALTLLQREEGALHALFRAFERGDDLPECVLAIENAARASNNGAPSQNA
uniref:Peptidase M41 domain-containing protein n=1 Tax=Calcidiscus leptoporus TaxID=127549 RepID=A0A7S0NXT6_9EUKA|mmetsp:Transcript_36575/g.85443  ORF Transcript_36575/g.85443 Transcript_36575/m.85443 type:complete len:294 (+) Transcript_36575:77-958(+)|eukprot:CAMPEP_0119358866 /NCGR_PEP_ID=MMETSP1334-20130426/6926_1 /TAXON_ID=127549 /ORGANISM="Calcidiscus leptoporus, Strain RCC1130" /LENGTH=293 /DNA_ID=CAMNT_0007373427 /DNA_START=67 /DNA_END=948 /DNA_ORIENTATION=+